MQQEKNTVLDTARFHAGTENSAYLTLGCHLRKTDGGYRYLFRLWAPRAHRVDLVSDGTGWDAGLPLSRREDGIFEGEISSPVSLDGMKYKYRVCSDGGVRYKGDPYACRSEGGAGGASLVTDGGDFPWSDGLYMAERRRRRAETARNGKALPMHIYELHAASFLRHGDGGYLSYRELADALVGYLPYMGYTHVELLPIAEYPYDGSWGYQIGAYFAPTSRFGSPDDLRYLVDRLHRVGIGVLLDWVPAHFPKDEWGLFELDGAPLYEYTEEWRREARGWGTRYFDLGRPEVRSFLLSNAMYWLREFHIDGLRVDAVASMLYLNYDRGEGEWYPNRYGDARSLEAISFFSLLNKTVHAEIPDALMIAEESTAYDGVTRAADEGGLGFDLKWNMGWAGDMLRYLTVDPIHRRHHHRALNFPMMYAYSERYILPVSHDEVVHGKGSLIGKMAGSYEQKFAQMRAFLMYMMSFPGKKLTFMGCEYGQFTEWCYDRSLEWFLLDYPTHRALRDFVRALNHFYLATPALYELDESPNGFSWLLADAADQNTVAYLRTDGQDKSILAVISFSGATERVRLDAASDSYTVVFDADGKHSGERLRAETDENGRYLTVTLPPFGGFYLAPSERATEYILPL